MSRKRFSHLNTAVQLFQLVFDRCSVSHPDHGTAVPNLAHAHLQGYMRNDLQHIDIIISLFRYALAFRPQCHLDHPLSIYNLTRRKVLPPTSAKPPNSIMSYLSACHTAIGDEETPDEVI